MTKMTPTNRQTFVRRIRLAAGLIAAFAVAALLNLPGSAASPRFFDDDPIWIEHDTEDASGMKPLEINLMVDLTYNMLTGRQPDAIGRAKNINTVDEVPDSSWFTNRLGHRTLTASEMANGPDTTAGPAPGTWTVISSKSDGITPGFTVKDSTGQRWFLKFDPPGYRAMATGTEVAVTKLMWALGYNVPENHVAYLRRTDLAIGHGATFTPANGYKRAMQPRDLDQLLARVDREQDGSFRVVASKGLAGTPIGRVRFAGTRPDDPNDVVPHEDRRELRAYGTFAAWLNHVDAKAINSLDMLVSEGVRGVVRHHLLDFGSTLGSAGVGPAEYWEGSQYLFEPGPTGKQLAGFGFVFPKWHTARFYEAPAIGRLPADNTTFDPERWKPRVPNQAFLHARTDDKFWAASKLAALNAELIRAAVHTGEFDDPASEAFLVTALAQRRDAIVRTYMTAVNPIADPVLNPDGVLTFRNAAVDADVAKAPRGYRATWFAFDNATGSVTMLGESTGHTPSLEAPRKLPQTPGGFVKILLRSVGSEYLSWETPVDAYFCASPEGWRLIGFERLPNQSVGSEGTHAESNARRSH